MNEDDIPICVHCRRAIWRHVYGGEVIWRHFDGFILCQPDEDAPDFTGVEGATPTRPGSPPRDRTGV